MRQALYRKYRPKTFDKVYGQTHITDILKNQIKNNNIAHAYIFSGTRGTGKTSCAKIFARAVNCLEETDGNPCNECENCRSILNETTMDIVEMDAASNRRIDDIRELRDKVIYPPANVKYKVYIIDEAHMITNEGFNALLKIMEEPPKHLIFILATTELEKIPVTIQSRCQKFEFHMLQIEDIIANLRDILDDLHITVEQMALERIALQAGGAMRDALSILDQVLSFEKKHYTVKDVEDILGVVEEHYFFELVDKIREKDYVLTLRTFETMMKDRAAEEVVKGLTEHFRNLMLVQVEAKDRTEHLKYQMERYEKQARSLDMRQIAESIRLLLQAQQTMRQSDQPKIIAEMTVYKLIDYIDYDEMSSRIYTLEQKVKALEARLVTVGEIPVQKPDEGKPIIEEKAVEINQPEKKSAELKPSSENAEKKNTESSKKKEEIDPEQWQRFLQQLPAMVQGFLKMGATYSISDRCLKIHYPEKSNGVVTALTKRMEELRVAAKKIFSVRDVVIEKDEKKKMDIEEVKNELTRVFGEGNFNIQP